MSHRLALCVCITGLLQYAAAVKVPVLDVHKGSLVTALYAGPKKLQSKCEEHYRNTTLDHFSWVSLCYCCCCTDQQQGGKQHDALPASDICCLQGPTDGHKETYTQRYFLCKDAWKPGGPIFL